MAIFPSCASAPACIRVQTITQFNHTPNQGEGLNDYFLGFAPGWESWRDQVLYQDTPLPRYGDLPSSGEIQKVETIHELSLLDAGEDLGGCPENTKLYKKTNLVKKSNNK